MEERVLFDTVCNLKLSSRQFARQSAKSAKLGLNERAKVKAALVSGDTTAANMHAENAIRHATESANMMRISLRIDGVVTRLDTHGRMLGISKSISQVVSSLNRALGTQNLEKIVDTLGSFEKQCDDLQVRADCLETTMDRVVTSSIPPDDVKALVQQVAHENSIDFGASMPSCSRDRARDELVERFERIKWLA